MKPDELVNDPVVAETETPEAAFQRGYVLGIEHATEEFQSRAPIAAPAATPTAPR